MDGCQCCHAVGKVLWVGVKLLPDGISLEKRNLKCDFLSLDIPPGLYFNASV